MDHGDFFMKRNNYSRKTLTLARKLVRMHKEATDHWNAGNETGASTAYHDPAFLLKMAMHDVLTAAMYEFADIPGFSEWMESVQPALEQSRHRPVVAPVKKWPTP